MGVFNTVDSGTRKFSTRFKRNFRCGSDVTFGKAYPVYSDFVLPGDTFRFSYDMLVRLMPLKAPLLNNINARIRFGFVPLRLVEDDTAFVITGSKDGKNKANFADNVPDFENVFVAWKNAVTADGGTVNDNTTFTVVKHSLAEWLFGIVPGTYKYGNVKELDSAPAAYWVKGLCRFWFDYYRDENLCSYEEFEDLYNYVILNLFTFSSYTAVQCLPVFRKKDYFVSSLPWQLKGIAPRIPIALGFNNTISNNAGSESERLYIDTTAGSTDQVRILNVSSTQAFNAGVNFSNWMTAGLRQGSYGVPVDEIREGFAETRIFERLARCGSRYTEYLMSNFGTSPADGTLQRAQYLGGGKLPIVVSEVLQTAQDTNSSDEKTPVGTMRGHGITRGGNGLQTCHFKEFGMVFAFVDIMPQTIYTQGISRRFSYKNRWDFVNPSFQHLSEQLIRKGEIYFANDTNNDSGFGYTGIYNELRCGDTQFRGNLRDNLSYWSQAIVFNSRPNLNEAFISLQSTDYLRPFAVTDESLGYPMILDINILNDGYRPLVRESTPGLIDHF